MSNVSLNELTARAKEVFSSIILFCPNFPAAAKTNSAKKFDQLIEFVNAVFKKTSDEDAKKWIRLSLKEILEARAFYEQGATKEGCHLMQTAEEHFTNGIARKSRKPRFIAGESGAASDADSGFPA
jgi:hypothetical protein